MPYDSCTGEWYDDGTDNEASVWRERVRDAQEQVRYAREDLAEAEADLVIAEAGLRAAEGSNDDSDAGQLDQVKADGLNAADEILSRISERHPAYLASR